MGRGVRKAYYRKQRQLQGRGNHHSLDSAVLLHRWRCNSGCKETTRPCTHPTKHPYPSIYSTYGSYHKAQRYNGTCICQTTTSLGVFSPQQGHLCPKTAQTLELYRFSVYFDTTMGPPWIKILSLALSKYNTRLERFTAKNYRYH